MKLIIQIPCYNEEHTLPQTLAELPTHIDGIESIEIQVVNDGSTDRTVQVARALGVHHILSFKRNRGLAVTFNAGVQNALILGADILVNTDADNQYRGADVEAVVRPILEGKADIVIGARPIADHPEFSWIKRKLQKLGSSVVRQLSRTDVKDATSGFRAYSREALMHLHIYSDFSYTLETIIQAGYQNTKIHSVPIRINKSTRESRLFRNIWQYMWRSAKTLIHLLILYRAGSLFTILSIWSFLAASLLTLRYMYLIYFEGAAMGSMWPTLILSGSLLVLSVQFYLTGIISTLIAANRKLGEEVIYRMRKLEFGLSVNAAAQTQPERTRQDAFAAAREP